MENLEFSEIRNYTPHKIVVVKNSIFNKDVRKNIATDETVVITEILPYGELLNAQFSTPMDIGTVCGVSIIETHVITCDTLPEGEFYCLVSAMYVSALQKLGNDTSRCLTIGAPVYDLGKSETIPMGTLNLRTN